MPAIKTGQIIQCAICGTSVYKTRSYIARGARMTCGTPECKSANVTGSNNPFWGKNHDADTRQRMSAHNQEHPRKGTGPKKGIFKQSTEAKAKMSAALKERWITNREAMISALPRGDIHPMKGLHPEPRHRIRFSNLHKKEWISDACFWCASVEDLVLDHVLPVMCGGTNVQSNAQTLCQKCNLWKMVYVDRPLMLALGSKGGRS